MFIRKTFRIITDIKEWYFIEYLCNKRKLSFKLSKLVTIIYKDKDMQAKVKRILRYIAWLLEEAQKLDSDL